jgi:hypothetical protein
MNWNLIIEKTAARIIASFLKDMAVEKCVNFLLYLICSEMRLVLSLISENVRKTPFTLDNSRFSPKFLRFNNFVSIHQPFFERPSKIMHLEQNMFKNLQTRHINYSLWNKTYKWRDIFIISRRGNPADLWPQIRNQRPPDKLKMFTGPRQAEWRIYGGALDGATSCATFSTFWTDSGRAAEQDASVSLISHLNDRLLFSQRAFLPSRRHQGGRDSVWKTVSAPRGLVFERRERLTREKCRDSTPKSHLSRRSMELSLRLNIFLSSYHCFSRF